MLKTLLLITTTILVLDGVWLSIVAEPAYTKMRKLLNPSAKVLPLNILAAVAAYVAMVVSLMYLTVPHISKTNRLTDSIFYGVMWGVGVYGTFNFTNAAIIGNYPLSTGLMDLAWGCFLGSVATYVGSFAN